MHPLAGNYTCSKNISPSLLQADQQDQHHTSKGGFVPPFAFFTKPHQPLVLCPADYCCCTFSLSLNTFLNLSSLGWITIRQ